MDDVVEANKEPSQLGTSQAGDGTRQQLEENSMPSDSLEQLKFKWKKPSPKNQKSACEEADDIGNEFPCGEVHVCIEKELSGDISPYTVVDDVRKFASFITDIVIPQIVLYCQQNSNVFTTNVIELKEFFGMHLVMGYHALPTLRD